MEQRRALVVGAGIGGLAAAIALQRAGLHVVVIERAQALRELGFALLLASNAVRALRRLGIAERVLAESEIARDGELRSARGRVLKRISMERIRQQTGEDIACSLRQVLHGALVDGAGSAELRTNAHALRFSQTPDAVALELEGGERLTASLLVAADGIHSRLRAQLHGDPLRPSGLVGYRGVCRGASWSTTGTQYFGRGVELGVARAGQGAIYWYLSTKRDPALDALDAKAAVLRLVQGFDPALVALIERTEPEQLRADDLIDREPLQHWGEGRVTLLGDAAHPMLPHAGQGAAQALEDAVALGQSLAAGADIPAALRSYERQRIPRTSHVVRVSRRNAAVASLKSRWACALRDLVLEHGPAALMERQLVALAGADGAQHA